MNNPLLIWDKPSTPKDFLGRVILLDSLSEEKPFISLPAYLEKNAEENWLKEHNVITASE